MPSRRLPCAAEAYRCLVALPVFKTGEAEQLGLAGSIPVRLRQTESAAPGQHGPIRRRPAAGRCPGPTPVLADRPRAGRPRRPAGGRASVRDAVKQAVAGSRRAGGRLDPTGRRSPTPPWPALPASRARARRRCSTRPAWCCTPTSAARRCLRAAVEALIGRAPATPTSSSTWRPAGGPARGRGALAALAAAVPGGRGRRWWSTTAPPRWCWPPRPWPAGREVRGQPRRDGGDRRRLPAARPDRLDRRPAARGRDRPTAPRRPTTPTRSGPRPGCILKVHPSNFRVEGFTSRRRRRRAGRPRRAGGRRHRQRAAAARPAAARRARRRHRPAGRRRRRHRQRRQAARRAAGRAAARARPTWSSGCAATRWPGPCGSTSSPWPRSRRPCAVRPRRPGPRCTPTPTGCGHACEALAAALTAASGRGGAQRPARSAAAARPGWRCPAGRSRCPTAYAAALRDRAPAVVGRVERGRCLLDLRCVAADDDPGRRRGRWRSIWPARPAERARRRHRRARRPRQVDAGPGADRDGARPLRRGAAARHDHRPRLRLDAGRCRPGETLAFVDVPGHERFIAQHAGRARSGAGGDVRGRRRRGLAAAVRGAPRRGRRARARARPAGRHPQRPGRPRPPPSPRRGPGSRTRSLAGCRRRRGLGRDRRRAATSCGRRSTGSRSTLPRAARRRPASGSGSTGRSPSAAPAPSSPARSAPAPCRSATASQLGGRAVAGPRPAEPGRGPRPRSPRWPGWRSTCAGSTRDDGRPRRRAAHPGRLAAAPTVLDVRLPAAGRLHRPADRARAARRHRGRARSGCGRWAARWPG